MSALQLTLVMFGLSQPISASFLFVSKVKTPSPPCATEGAAWMGLGVVNISVRMVCFRRSTAPDGTRQSTASCRVQRSERLTSLL